MSKGWILLTLVLTSASCGGGSALTTDATSSARQCRHDRSLGDGGPGSCGVGRAVIVCDLPNGGTCGCITDDTTCGSTCSACTNKCNANEYAAGCGFIGPGDPSITYAAPPAACRVVRTTHDNDAYFCCPCL